MNIGLFGGTFDPVHRGHVALARAAMERCKLHRVYFVPVNVPPHKQKQSLTPFVHRFAMLVLATANEKAFVPSLLEAQDGESRKKDKPNYTIDTVRRLKQHSRTVTGCSVNWDGRLCGDCELASGGSSVS
jgi:nicotinate-nucleotide adenylyltransferase